MRAKCSTRANNYCMRPVPIDIDQVGKMVVSILCHLWPAPCNNNGKTCNQLSQLWLRWIYKNLKEAPFLVKQLYSSSPEYAAMLTPKYCYSGNCEWAFTWDIACTCRLEQYESLYIP